MWPRQDNSHVEAKEIPYVGPMMENPLCGGHRRVSLCGGQSMENPLCVGHSRVYLCGGQRDSLCGAHDGESLMCGA